MTREMGCCVPGYGSGSGLKEGPPSHLGRFMNTGERRNGKAPHAAITLPFVVHLSLAPFLHDAQLSVILLS